MGTLAESATACLCVAGQGGTERISIVLSAKPGNIQESAKGLAAIIELGTMLVWEVVQGDNWRLKVYSACDMNRVVEFQCEIRSLHKKRLT